MFDSDDLIDDEAFLLQPNPEDVSVIRVWFGADYTDKEVDADGDWHAEVANRILQEFLEANEDIQEDARNAKLIVQLQGYETSEFWQCFKNG